MSGCLGIHPPCPVGRACLSDPPCPQEMEDGKSPQITVWPDLDFVKIALAQLRLRSGLDPSSKATAGEPRGPPAQTSAAPSPGFDRAKCAPSGARQPHGWGRRGSESSVGWPWAPGCRPLCRSTEKALSQHTAPGAQEPGQPPTHFSPALWGGGTPCPTERLRGPAPSALAPCLPAPLSPSCGLSTRELPRASPHPDHRMCSCGNFWESRPLPRSGWGHPAAQKALLRQRLQDRGWGAGKLLARLCLFPAE